MRDKKQEQSDFTTSAPLMRLRHLAGVAMFIAAFTAVPLLVVWKQVYINNVSIRYTALCDSLVVLNKEATSLKLISERQWATERIESIARNRLGLEYTTSDQIVIVNPDANPQVQPAIGGSGFFAVLKKSIFPDKRS